MFIVKRKTGTKVEYLSINEKGQATSTEIPRQAFRSAEREYLQTHADRANSGQVGGGTEGTWEVKSAAEEGLDDDDNDGDTSDKAAAQGAFEHGHQIGSSESTAFLQGVRWAEGRHGMVREDRRTVKRQGTAISDDNTTANSLHAADLQQAESRRRAADERTDTGPATHEVDTAAGAAVKSGDAKTAHQHGRATR